MFIAVSYAEFLTYGLVEMTVCLTDHLYIQEVLDEISENLYTSKQCRCSVKYF